MKQSKAILENYWGYFALFAWIGGALLFDLVRLSPFAIDEEAAKGLLLAWTIADNVVNPIVIFGMPDFRALLLAPAGAYWPGNLLATKIMSLILSFIAVTMLYRWARKTFDPESALIAAVLLLVSPVMIGQVDSLSAGPYILLGFALGAWLNTAYRKNDNYFGGWYFTQMLWVTILATLHPIALAYPIALAWHWYKNPHETKKSRHMYVGIGISLFLAIAMQRGWNNIEFFANPFEALATSLQGAIVWSAADINWVPGIIAGLLLVLAVSSSFQLLTKNLLSQMLLISVGLGALMADENWALISITLLIFLGAHQIIKLNQSKLRSSFIGQRGLVVVFALIISAFFMIQDKNHALTIKHAILAPVDEMIQSMIAEAENKLVPFRAASEWPGRTMLATKRDVLPLPPALEDPEEMLEAVKSVTHLVFNPFVEKNKPLADAISLLRGETETVALFKAGAIIRVKHSNVPLSTGQRLALESEKKEATTSTTETETPKTTE